MRPARLTHQGVTDKRLFEFALETCWSMAKRGNKGVEREMTTQKS
jgi:hypothetical protein